MNDDNPFRPPAVSEPGLRSLRSPAGAILSGLIAIGLATFLMGPLGLIAALLGVGSWWAYRFRPKPPVPDVPAARDYLERLEDGRAAGSAIAQSGMQDDDDSRGGALRNLRH